VLEALARRLEPWPDLVTARPRWHLTLRFLGEEEDVAGVARALEPLAACGRFPARLGGAGTFGSGRGRRVLWVGLSEGGEAMAALATSVARALALEPEGHVPHLTLRRAPSGAARAVAATLGDDPVGPAWTVDRVLLEASSFPRQPVEHTVLAEVPLA
jgi:2'-5' RNA ligase